MAEQDKGRTHRDPFKGLTEEELKKIKQIFDEKLPLRSRFKKGAAPPKVDIQDTKPGAPHKIFDERFPIKRLNANRRRVYK